MCDIFNAVSIKFLILQWQLRMIFAYLYITDTFLASVMIGTDSEIRDI